MRTFLNSKMNTKIRLILLSAFLTASLNNSYAGSDNIAPAARVTVSSELAESKGYYVIDGKIGIENRL
jgi:hypothetical protein